MVQGRSRLPTLLEVLDRETAAPVDLDAFYAYMQSCEAAQLVDFWLEAHRHERLCTIYQYLNAGHLRVPEAGAWRDDAHTQRNSYVFLAPSQNPSENLPQPQETNITLFDLTTNAQRVYDRFLMPDAPYAIALPDTLLRTMEWPLQAHALTGTAEELGRLFHIPQS